MNRQTHTQLLQGYKKKYQSARYSLLLIILFTLINCIMLICGADSYFLFSAQFVYFIVLYAKLLTGKMDPSYYEGAEDLEFLPEGLYIAAIVFAVIALAVYFLCWFKSKDLHHKWLIASVVFFAADAVFSILLFGFSVDNIIDYVFAAYVIFSVSTGIKASANIAKLPEPTDVPEQAPEDNFGFAERDFSYDDGNAENADEKKDENN